jgi:hypothetical protein
MAKTVNRLVPRDGASDVGDALEGAALEALQGLEDEDLMVSFGVWDDGTGVQFICKVETPPGDPLSSDPPWRWWSPLFRTPEELRQELTRVVLGRVHTRESPSATLAASDSESAAAS